MIPVSFEHRKTKVKKLRSGEYEGLCDVCASVAHTNIRTGRSYNYDYAHRFQTGDDTTRFHLGVFCSDACFSQRVKNTLDPEFSDTS
jgi:hypothetical protein